MSALPRVALICPCGETLELNDLMDESPPIPYSAWPRRWTILGPDGQRLTACPSCGEELDHALDTLLPDYPWRSARARP